MSDEATLNADMGYWELFELYNEVADTHPTIKAGVAHLLGGAFHHQAFKDATKAQLDGVRSLLEAVIEAWSARHGILFEDTPGVMKELNRLRYRAEAKRIHDLETVVGGERRDRIHRGGDAIFDQPTGTPAVWGHDDEVLWAEGEPFLLVAPTGVGKTTVMGQVVAGMLTLVDDNQVLGWHVNPADRILYMAMDRPRQIKRSLRRHFNPDDDRDVLNDRLPIWEGPPPVDFAKHPEALVEMCVRYKASHVILDSLKDCAVGIANDEVGAGLNNAIQLTIAEGIEVAGLHHQRKGQGGTKPKTLEDVYGSTWITAGAGSVVLLWGQAGDLIVELTHLKQPASEVGPLQVEHDHSRGVSTIYRGFDVLTFLRNRGTTGATSTDTAKQMFEKSKPTRNEVMKTKRKLDKLVAAGLAVITEEAQKGGTDGSSGALYQSVDAVTELLGPNHAPNHAPSNGQTSNDPITPITQDDETAGQSNHAPNHANHTPEQSRTPPSLYRGVQMQGHCPTCNKNWVFGPCEHSEAIT